MFELDTYIVLDMPPAQWTRQVTALRNRYDPCRYLLQNGVKSERVIATRGFGESKPVAGNETAAGRQVNRRVEIIIADQFDKQAKAGNQ